MKLAIIRTACNPIDIQSYNVQEIGLAKGLLKHGVSTDFYSLFKNIAQKTAFIIDGNNAINLIPLKIKTFFGKITYCTKLIDTVLENGYDLVQVHEDSQFMTPLILKACHKNGVKTVLYQGMYTDYSGFQYTYNLMFDLFFKKTIQKNASHIFSKTALAKRYLEQKGYQNISVLLVGLDEIEHKTCTVSDTIQKFKSRFQNILLYIGKIEQRRNPFFLMDILSRFSSDTAMIVIGKGDLYNKMLDCAKEKNTIDRLLLIDFVPNNEIHNIYSASDVFLLPTNYEIYGMVIMEALLNGLPVISTREAGPLSILTDKRLGVCLPLDIEKWINSIIYYFNNKSTEDSSYRKETVGTHFKWTNIAKQYYETVCKQNMSV